MAATVKLVNESPRRALFNLSCRDTTAETDALKIDVSALTFGNGELNVLRSFSIADGGTNYVVGDILTIAVGSGTAVRASLLKVTSVASGVIDGITIQDPGDYSTIPSDVTTNNPTGGATGDATFALVYTAAQSVAIASVQYSIAGAGVTTLVWDATANEDALVLSGNGFMKFEEGGNLLYNPYNAGSTGDILLSRLSALAADAYEIIIEVKKVSGFTNRDYSRTSGV